MKKIKILALILILIPSFSNASCYKSSGYGSTNANSYWYDSGLTYHSVPYYISTTTTWYLFNCGGTYKCINSTLIDSNVTYYISGNYTDTPWQYNNNAPAGSVTELTCYTGGTGTTTSLADISSMGDVTFGIAIIISILSFGLIAFAFNTINNKKAKPWK